MLQSFRTAGFSTALQVRACLRGALTVAGAAARPALAMARTPAYRAAVLDQQVPGGVVHDLPTDLCAALLADAVALAAWVDLTPLARNEFICWVGDAKREATRRRRIRRTQEELLEGMRRPCCWPGCKHRERIGRP